jgi:hypothetical protein
MVGELRAHHQNAPNFEPGASTELHAHPSALIQLTVCVLTCRHNLLEHWLKFKASRAPKMDDIATRPWTTIFKLSVILAV